MKRSNALMLIVAVCMFVVSLHVMPLNEQGQLDFQERFAAACLSVILMIPVIIAGIKVSVKSYKDVVAEEKTTKKLRQRI